MERNNRLRRVSCVLSLRRGSSLPRPGSVRARSATALALILMLLLPACTRTVYTPVERVSKEYVDVDTAAIASRVRSFLESVRQKEVRSDSVVDRQKEVVVLNEAGDTVRIRETHYIYLSSTEESELESKVAEKDSVIDILRSRLASVKTDSIPVPYPVERELTRWQQAKMDLGGLAFGAIGLALLALLTWLAIRFYIRRRKQ